MKTHTSFEGMDGKSYDILAEALKEQYAGLQEAANYFVRRIVKQDERKDNKIFDIGCGTGLSSIALQSAVKTQTDSTIPIIGIDPNSNMIAYATEKYGSSKKLSFQKGSHRDLRGYEQTQNHVFSSFLLHNLVGERRRKMLDEIAEALPPSCFLGTYDKMFDSTSEEARDENAELMQLYVPRLTDKPELCREFIAHELTDIQENRVLPTYRCKDLLRGAGLVNVHEHLPSRSLCARFVIGQNPEGME